MFLGNDSHFFTPSWIYKKLERDCRGLSLCYSTHISGAILKMSACYGKCTPSRHFDVVLPELANPRQTEEERSSLARAVVRTNSNSQLVYYNLAYIAPDHRPSFCQKL